MNDIIITWEGERGPFAKAFVAAQKATEAVKKASTNPAFKSKYADLAGVVEAVVPALNAHGIGVLQIPGFNGDLASVSTTLLHESGASVTGVLHLRPSKADPQGVGSAITYGRRYSLLAMTGAAPEDDDGNEASRPSQQQRQAPPPPQQPSLSDRASTFEGRMKAAKNPAELDRVWKLGEGLRKELDGKDPETLAGLQALRNTLDAELPMLEAA